MRLLLLSIFLVGCLAGTIPLPSYPLAVRNPYLSAWLSGSQANNVTTSTAQFSTSGAKLTWIVLARVNGQAYVLFGSPQGVNNAKYAIQKSIQYTSTHTTIALDAGSSTFTLDFFSPVAPNDYVRQSLPYSYLTVSVTDSGSSPPSVDVFSAIDDSWTAQQGATASTFQIVNNTRIFTLSGTHSIPFTQKADQATWGNTVFASRASDGSSISCSSGTAASVQAAFVSKGKLQGQVPYATGDLLACSHNLGNVTGTSSATFVIGLQQSQAIQYNNGTTTAVQTGYYATVVQSLPNVVNYVVNDYAAAKTQCSQLDNQVKTIGASVSTNYTDLLEASVRQSFASLELTVPLNSLDTSQAAAFMKEISTDGNVNTLADLIPKSVAIFYVLNPEYIRLLVDPVLKWSLKTWTPQYAVHDIGKNYPNATGETIAANENLYADETSVLLWLVYLYQKKTGNTSWAKPYISILQRYADYCANNGLYPIAQRSSTDSIAPSANQTVLSTSCAIGLKAFGTLTSQANYTKLGDSFAAKIVNIGRDPSKTHFIIHYGDNASSWLMMYPLAMDRLLGLNTFNTSVANAQSAFLAGQEHKYGIPLTSEVNMALYEWEMWIASISPTSLRNYFINSVHEKYVSGLDDLRGPTQWNVTGQNIGVGFTSTAKPLVGASFMVYAVANAQDENLAQLNTGSKDLSTLTKPLVSLLTRAVKFSWGNS